MDPPPNDSRDDRWIDDLVRFDEALRLGRDPKPAASLDPDIEQAQQFLLRLQTMLPRRPKQIGQYTIVRNLGQGTLGTAYLVQMSAEQPPLVLKGLWPELVAHPEVQGRLEAEIGIVRQLSHPDIATVREYGKEGALSYLLCEFSPGVSLAQWRRRRPQPIAWEIATAFIARLAEILRHAHQAGISHGNLKPSNVFLTQKADVTLKNLHQAAVRIGDFGLAKVVQETKLTSGMGLPWPMPQYLAPEQLRHRTKQATPAADVYALGLLWYELLTGRCPVKGATREEIIAQGPDSPPPSPRQFRPEIPSAIDALVLQCLRRNMGDRPASALPLGEALRELLPIAKKESPAWWKQWLGWK